jgi:hypothetical protein
MNSRAKRANIGGSEGHHICHKLLTTSRDGGCRVDWLQLSRSPDHMSPRFSPFVAVSLTHLSNRCIQDIEGRQVWPCSQCLDFNCFQLIEVSYDWGSVRLAPYLGERLTVLQRLSLHLMTRKHILRSGVDFRKRRRRHLSRWGQRLLSIWHPSEMN